MNNVFTLFLVFMTQSDLLHTGPLRISFPAQITALLSRDVALLLQVLGYVLTAIRPDVPLPCPHLTEANYYPIKLHHLVGLTHFLNAIITTPFPYHETYKMYLSTFPTPYIIH